MDKPFLQENSTIAFLIEWGGLILFLALVLAPFFVLLWKKLRPTKLKHIVAAYLGSFGVYLFLFFLIGKIDRYIYNNFVNTAWLQDPFINILINVTLPLFFAWPLGIFYCTKLLYKKFNKKRFFISLGLSILFLVLLIAILLNVMAWGIGYIGRNYF